jgi:hypothetical protein
VTHGRPDEPSAEPRSRSLRPCGQDQSGAEHGSATGQALAQHRPASSEAAGEGSFGEPESLRRVSPREAVELAKDNGIPITTREPLDFLIEQCEQLLTLLVGRGGDTGPIHCLLLPSTSPRRLPAGCHRRADCHAVEPGFEPLVLPKGSCLSRQHEEDGLESVLGIHCLGEDPATDPQNHRTMSTDERRERLLPLVPVAARESVDQLRVRQLG